MSLEPSASPFGFQPFGLGTPVAAPEPPSGTPKLSRFLDPATRDFSVDPASKHLADMPTVRQRFLLLATTLVGSSSVLPELGVEVPRIIDDAFARQVDVAVRIAARQMTEIEKVARIERVTVNTTPLGSVLVLVSYADLTLGIVDSITAALR